MTASLREEMADRFDRFGDSLTVKISSAEEMRQLLKQVQIKDVQLSARELKTGQTNLLGKDSGFRIFQGLVALLYTENLKNEIELYKAKFRMLKFVREGGQWIGETSTKGVTTVFVVENEALDKERLEQWLDGLVKQNLNVNVLRVDWIDCSLRKKRTCDEKLFKVF